MAGHSKWANIKHRKAKQDASRGKLFTKFIRELTTAAKPEHVAYDFDKVSNILKDAGFMYYTVFENRVPAFIKL